MVCYEAYGVGGEIGAVGASAVGEWGEIWGVCFDEELVSGGNGQGAAKMVVGGVGDDTGKAEPVAAFDAGAGVVGITGEGVHDDTAWVW